MNDQPAEPNPAICTVWRSRKRAYTYLYLQEDKKFDELPEPLRTLFAEAEVAMELDLNRRESLAHADIAVVREHLKETGYYLQLPPEDDPSGWLDLPPRNA